MHQYDDSLFVFQRRGSSIFPKPALRPALSPVSSGTLPTSRAAEKQKEQMWRPGPAINRPPPCGGYIQMPSRPEIRARSRKGPFLPSERKRESRRQLVGHWLQAPPIFNPNSASVTCPRLNSATILPSYMTRIRPERERISSSSAEINKPPAPRSRASMILR